MTARFLALTALVLTWAAPARAQPEALQLEAPPVSGRMSDIEIATGLDAWLADLSRQGLFSGAVLVGRNGREIYAGAYGVSDIAGRSPLAADTLFPLASIGKAFTHVAVAQLIQAGRLSPAATIAELLPDYPNAVSREATVGQLLHHSGGISDIFGPAFREAPKERFASNHDYFTFVSQQPARFTPGEREEYCNGCYVVLGEIVERVSGQRYEDYVVQNVFAPAGMMQSGFPRHDRLPAGAARFTGRPMGPQGELMDVSGFHGVAGSGAGNAYSTTRDLLAFDNALREHRLINAEHTAELLRSEPQTGRNTSRVGMAGGGPGVNTMMFGNGAWTLIVLANREPPIAEAIGEVVFPLLAGPRPQ